YTADIKTAKGKVVNFDDPDINVTVHYSANEQTATITYIDDTTKNNLDSKVAKGKFNQVITFATAPTDEIANYEKQGYKLVSNDFNNQKYQADNNNNVFYVHLKRGTTTDNPGSNGGGDQGTTPTPEPVPEPTPSPDDQPDTTLPSDNNTDKDVEKDKQDKPEEMKKARKIIKTRITKQEHIGNAEKAEHLTEQEHNDQTVVSPVKNEANEPQLPQTGEANTSVIGLLGMLVAGFAAILGFESSRSRKHKN
ncbi:mucin-binding protein, partial [Lactobacillus gigeriorum]